MPPQRKPVGHQRHGQLARKARQQDVHLRVRQRLPPGEHDLAEAEHPRLTRQLHPPRDRQFTWRGLSERAAHAPTRASMRNVEDDDFGPHESRGPKQVGTDGASTTHGLPAITPPTIDSEHDFLLAGCLINADGYERRKAELSDADGDGVIALDDCDDEDAGRSPELEEVPYDGIDQDCDGVDLDDVDEDGFPLGEDCNDDDPSVHPDGTEVAYDGVDQDCDGADLDDLDGDGYARADDCDDDDAAIHPGAAETWADAFSDDDCDGALEQDAPAVFGGTLWYSSTPGAGLGSRVEPYADLDANGIAEVIVPAIAANRRFPNGGAVYLLSTTSVGDVDEGALAVIEAGGTDWYLGVAVDARDIDGDALPEVLLTAPGKDTTGAGYLVLGAALTAGEITLPDDAAFAFDGSEAATYWGSDIAFLGDVDGDGVDEVAMSASFAAVEGAEAAGRVAVFSLTSPVNATADPDYRWDGYYADGRFGETVASVGDVDGDGLTDTLVSAEQGDIFVVLPGVSGSIVDIALSRVTRDGDCTGPA